MPQWTSLSHNTLSPLWIFMPRITTSACLSLKVRTGPAAALKACGVTSHSLRSGPGAWISLLSSAPLVERGVLVSSRKTFLSIQARYQ